MLNSHAAHMSAKEPASPLQRVRGACGAKSGVAGAAARVRTREARAVCAKRGEGARAAAALARVRAAAVGYARRGASKRRAFMDSIFAGIRHDNVM